jgi:hypothetical protein
MHGNSLLTRKTDLKKKRLGKFKEHRRAHRTEGKTQQ